MKIFKQDCRLLELPKIEIIMVFDQAIVSDDAEYVFKKPVENFPFHLDRESSSIFVDMMCKRPTVKNNNVIYEYLKTEDKWNPIVSDVDESVFHDKGKPLQINRNHSKGCFTNDNTYMLCGGDLMNYVEWIHLRSGDVESEKASIFQERQYQRLLETLSPLSGVRYHTVTRIRENVTMIIGGEKVSNHKNG